MRKSKKVLVGAVVSGTLIVGGVAVAATINGNDRPNDLYGTPGPDVMNGFGGDDDLYGLGGNDVLRGGPGGDDLYGGPGADRIFPGTGPDDVYAGPGNDRINAVDTSEDDISCGPGRDHVVANPGDDVSPDCERVDRRGVVVGDGDGTGGGGGSTPPGGTVITRAQAGQIAVAHVGGGRVDWIEREDDYGAAWEVDVETARGEYEVYVSATGVVVKVLGPFAD